MRMKAWIGGALLGALVLGGAQAETETGRLELLWGDPTEGAAIPYQFRATLIRDDGSRIPLDTDQALRAAGDLYGLGNRRIAVAYSTQSTAKSGLRRPAQRSIQAIVPADAQGAASEKILGTTAWVTIACKFADIATEQKPVSFFQGQYGNAQGQLDHYWREVSYNKINLTGSSAAGWFTLPQPRSYYVTGSGQGSANLNQLFDDCTAAADASVNFAVNGGVQGINMMFNGDLDGYAWGGGRCATLDGVYKCWSTTWNPPWSFNNLAPLAHEMGHGYGLPHANNSDNDTDPYDNPWDVMSSAWNNAATNATYGTVAKHINTYHRDRMGWVDAARKRTITAGTHVAPFQLDRAGIIGSSASQMVVVRITGQPTSQYFTVESRQRSGYYESNLAGNAVIIHAVNTARGEPAWSVDSDVPPANLSNNEGSMFKPGETWTAPGGQFRVRVWSENASGFLVSVCGPVPAGGIGRSFDACDLGPSDINRRPR